MEYAMLLFVTDLELVKKRNAMFAHFYLDRAQHTLPLLILITVSADDGRSGRGAPALSATMHS